MSKMYLALTLMVYSVFGQALEMPKCSSGVISHTGFTLSYNEQHEQANWVAYELTKEETVKKFERTDKFLTDGKVATQTANNNDYAGSGYDKGHLAPAADLSWSEASIKESFYFSNISPQVPGFNRGIWKDLESLVRDWAIEYGNIYVVTGPILSSGLPAIGANRVSVPKEYFKVILDYTSPDIKGIGFILKNEPSTNELKTFAVSIDSVEKASGIDFFYQVPDDVESLIESCVCVGKWTWGESNTNTPSSYSGSSSSSYSGSSSSSYSGSSSSSYSGSVQCSGTTQKGARCKRMTTSSNGRCYQH